MSDKDPAEDSNRADRELARSDCDRDYTYFEQAFEDYYKQAPESPDEIASGVLQVAFGLKPDAERDRRFAEYLAKHGSLAELHMRLNDFKDRKYRLLKRYPDLEPLRDVHPQRNCLARLDRQIRLFEEAIETRSGLSKQSDSQHLQRRGYREEVKAFVKAKGLTQSQAANKLNVSLDTLKAIMRGDSKRYSSTSLQTVLTGIGFRA